MRQEVAPDSASSQAAAYLRELGITNRAELSQIVDITMNPNSLFRVSLPGPRSDSRGAPNRLVRSTGAYLAGWSCVATQQMGFQCDVDWSC